MAGSSFILRSSTAQGWTGSSITTELKITDIAGEKGPPARRQLHFAWAILLMLFLHTMELGIWGVALNLVGPHPQPA